MASTAAMSEYEHKEPEPKEPEKLRFFSSPVVESSSKSAGHSDPSDDDLPVFQRREESTPLETFYDLFFAASYGVFTKNQLVTNLSRFKSFVGYFSLLWLTWLLVTLYDVRFLTDNIFERITRAVQLGVMVGFAVVAPKFDPDNQDPSAMRAMSITLMISRACLAVEYGGLLWHVRKFKRARQPLYVQIALNIIACLIYLGITFRFGQGRSRVFITWYVVSAMEAVLVVAMSNVWSVLSLTKTHLMKRLCLLTVIMLGDSLVNVAEDVVTFVKRIDYWSSAAIGITTAAVAVLYFIFLVYFDWLRSSYHLPALRQQLWTVLHYPFHLALVLFVQGLTQFLLWSLVIDWLHLILQLFAGVIQASSNVTQIQNEFATISQAWFTEFPPQIEGTNQTVSEAISNISTIPIETWKSVQPYLGLDSVQPDSLSDLANDAIAIVSTIYIAMANAIYKAFNIDVTQDLIKKDPSLGRDTDSLQIMSELKTWTRFGLVFAYEYLSNACVILFMILMAIVVRRGPMKVWPIVRAVTIFLLALGVGLVALLYYQPAKLADFINSPWVIPAITFVWTVILVLTHINGGIIKRHQQDIERWWTYVPIKKSPVAGRAADKRKTAVGDGDRGTNMQSQYLEMQHVEGAGANFKKGEEAGVGSR